MKKNEQIFDEKKVPRKKKKRSPWRQTGRGGAAKRTWLGSLGMEEKKMFRAQKRLRSVKRNCP